MHVAVVMNTAWGVKTLRSDLIRYLQSRGHRVSVVAHADAAEEGADLQRMGVTFEEWPISRSGLNPIHDGFATLRLGLLLARIRPEVVLSFTPKAILLCSIAARVTPRSHVFSVFTGLGYLFGDDSTLKRFILFLFRWSLKNNPLVFFQNPDDLQQFVQGRIVPHERTSRIYGSGVDTNRFSPAPPSSHRPETVFLMIARLIVPKGVIDYIGAAQILKREGWSARFRLLGQFDDHPTAVDRDTIQSAIGAGTIEYCGTTADVRPYLQDADVFVLPSYYGEGTPRSSLEALAMAKPIITTDSRGCRETVIHESNGYLVPVQDPIAIAEAMRKLVGNRDRIQAMGAKSRQLAEELYEVNKVHQQLWREISRVIHP